MKHFETVAIMPVQRKNELPFHPFHSGALHLSVYRSATVDPKQYDASRNYPAVLESFIKRRPLSEVFATPISNLDLSSSSDEDLTDPIPESPLNLSDAESMASGQSSPFTFHRRRKGRPETRPRSLYDAAKPQPPPKHTPMTSRPKPEGNPSIGDKFGRFINRRPWRHYKEAKQQEADQQISYEPGTDPVPESGAWTNIVGLTPCPADQPRHIPHPPATKPGSSAHDPTPAPRKKRQAPKPPTALPRPKTPEMAPNSEIPTVCATEATPLHEIPGTRPRTTPADVTATNGETSSHVAMIEDHVAVANDGQENTTSTYPASHTSDTPTNETQPHPHDPEGANATQRWAQTADNADDIGRNPAIDSSTACPRTETTSQPITTSSTASVVTETVTVATATPLSSSSAVVDICATILSLVISTHPDSAPKSAETVDNMPALADTDDSQQISLNKLAESASPEASSQDEQSHGDNTNGAIDDTIVQLSDEIIAAVNSTPLQAETPRSMSKHTDPSENASSGYSSPGSGDEGPISPEPVTSVITLGVPSPTSSYYSTSLSASSSRVSDMSRELTLMTSCGCENEKSVLHDQAPNEVGPQPQPHLGTDINMNDLPAKGRSQSESNVDPTPSKKECNKNVPDNNDSPLSDDRSRKLSSNSMPAASENTAVFLPPNQLNGYSSQSVVLRTGSRARIRPQSEYIPCSREREEWRNEANRVSICMVERPGDSSKLTSRYPSGFFKPPLPKAQGPSKKKALAAAQKSRAFAMRARVQLSKRHSYAANSEYFIDDETDSKPTVPSSNLVSHFVSTRNISTYYDGTDQRIVTPQEILTSKREEFFNAFKNTYRPQDQFGGSVQHLPVSAKEFAIQDVIPEVNEVESPVKPVNPFVAETRIVPDTAPEHQTSPATSPASVKTGSDDKENEITVHRQNSEASSSGSSTHHSSQTSTAFDGSTWSLSTDMTSNQSVRMRKPSLRRRLQGAFSFQNIRRAISMEKLSEEEKRRSMSHHYINEAGTHDLGAKSSTLGSDRSQKRDEPVRKSSSIMNMFPSVRMRKRRSRMHKDARNRYTISGPEDLPDEAELKNKRSPMRPMSLIVPSSYNRKKPDRVGNPSFFRPIGRVLQMNPIEGTLLVEMVKPPSGPFGFYIARKKGAGDSGNVFISRLSDSYPDKMFAGLMRTGDEITEVNGTDVAGLSLDQVYDLILDSERTLLKIKPSQVHVV